MEAWTLAVAAAEGGGERETKREAQLGAAARALRSASAAPLGCPPRGLLPPPAKLPRIL